MTRLFNFTIATYNKHYEHTKSHCDKRELLGCLFASWRCWGQQLSHLDGLTSVAVNAIFRTWFS